ncbi:Cys-tRNA(Pro)/Cys-tRNA(Cys) deacylase [Marinobacter segnicrescens]|uniref:Cys-tRNA(Pro)/Cys-tRNA(Cys) deacylase n=1 Tax=Marinobacter segnicrescens TaxID=430453 RepID=A0A1I0I1P6_9GAMM|nr:Cys-tRNA(Pro) deacylase [Marinobacter segnicrescens]SET89636.1 Cys-tRNA(Pro)/Cys-tRNA(Cys) deacylase [Marinobacter segnicrescens]
MTPAVDLVRKEGIAHTLHEYAHDPKSESYGTEAAEKLGLDPDQVFKTLVAETDTGELVVAIVPVSGSLNLKQLAKAARAKKAAMADKQKVQRTTGYVLGGVSPLGQKKALRTVIDESAQAFDSIHVSAGRRGLEIELAPADLADLTRASFAPIKA